MRAGVWLGVDVGTSSLKVIAVDADGVPVAEQETPLPLERPEPDRAEADPRAWTGAVDGLVLPLSEAYDVQAIGVTGQMHGTVLVGETGAPLGPAVLWPDSRAETVHHLWDALPAEELGRLGSPWSPGMTGPVLAWVAEHESETMARATRVVLPKDLVREHLVPGSRATDPSDASGTLLWDVTSASWSPGASALVPAHLLPDVKASNEVVGTWRGAEVVVGGGDTPASLLALEHAVGGWRPGDVVVNLGTGAQVIDPRTTPPTGSGWSDLHTYQGVLGGHYSMVAAQSAGLGLAWAQRQLAITWSELSSMSQQAPPGADGLLFSPFVASERGALSPTRPGAGWLPGATSAEQSTALAARAAAEAQAFLVRRSGELLDFEVARVIVVGGGARESWVRQLLADVLGKPVHHLPVRSASAAGAVILAGGPMLLQGHLSPATEPQDVPALSDAYERWRSAMYA